MHRTRGLVFFDLDKTLLNEQHGIDPTVRRALDELRANGYQPVIATGRPAAGIRDIMAASGIDSLVALNGQYVELAGDVVFSQTMASDVVARLTQQATARGVMLGYFNADSEWLSGMSPAVVAGYGAIDKPTPPIRPEDYLTQPVHMMMALTENLTDDQVLSAAFPELSFYRNFKFDIDIIPSNVSKVRGIEAVKAALGGHVPTFAFGDGTNDRTMIDFVDHGVAMGNALPEVKAVADYITADYNRGGIVQGLRHLGLIG
ncbi:Cof-type HAD-IIB family hydrolase [Lacticaseibacillus pantheris]|uniref:Cof-type HAD-IIB family hydrolase n=1 Tax=Lacticaseibacillus pantheris TaxID=171523 RepID=UPI002598E486|nr:Cof-type HAD-IIB family hydrolase [Lacticaseibacillus pantheris]WKF85310.1 Cof-type HAD-IIB family hydrolase [Lacticaseibacillus pantheris]